MQPQEFEFNTFRATVDSTTTVDGVPYYAVELEYYNERTFELMGYNPRYATSRQLVVYCKIPCSDDLHHALARINAKAELAMMMDAYTSQFGSDEEYGVNETSYTDVAERILQQFWLK